MGAERYSRLKALEDYGYEVNWNNVRDKVAVVAGVGGVGSVAVELLARFGVRKIHIIDLDRVEEVNLNRLVFREEHIGRPKVEVIKEVMTKVNPDVEVIAHFTDIMDFEFEDKLYEIINAGDIGLLCLDNVPARQHFNSICVRNNLPYVDSGLLRSGLGGYVHLVIPKQTACYQCLTPSGLNVTNDASGLPCSASLPTTVAMIASLQVQTVVKHLTKLGKIQDYITYNGLIDEIIHVSTRIDPGCPICN